MSRPRWRPSDRDRKEIETMAGYGMSQKHIAMIKGITEPTLRKYCKAELELGVAKAMLTATGQLFKGITRANTNMAAVIFYLKTHGGDEWRERSAQPMGKKEQAEADARDAEQGSEWAGLLN